MSSFLKIPVKGPLYDMDAEDKNTSPISYSISLDSDSTVTFHLIASSPVRIISFFALPNLASVSSINCSRSSFFYNILLVSSLNF